MFDSIRLRLTFWYVGMLTLVIAAFAGLTYFLVVKTLNRQTDENLSEMARNFKAAVDSELTADSDKSSIEREISENVAESRFHDFLFLVISTGDARRIASTDAADNLNGELLHENSKSEFETQNIRGRDFRVSRTTMNFGAGNYDLLIARNLEDEEEFLSRLRTVFLLAVPISLLAAGLSGYFLARKSLAPVAAMSRRAANIGANNLHERLPVENEKDEIGNLANTFNHLLLRLENSFEQQRRFMADASHELRTPLAIVQGESEVALAKENRPPAELRESLAIVNDESRRLTRIVEDLFTLARADAGQLKINRAEFYLDELLTDSVRRVQVLAKKRNITIDLKIAGEMPMIGDEQLLRRLFVNLLDNAIKYNRANGKITVAAETAENALRVLISDTGTGISEEEKTKVFERFYRADLARRRAQETATSGAGLGLSIALRIAELHGGSIEIISSSDAGSVFAIILPA